MSNRMLSVLFQVLLSIATIARTTQAFDSATPAFAIRAPHRICPMPMCSRVPSVAELRAPALGVALEMGYGYVVDST